MQDEHGALFVYGTLRDDLVLAAVIGRRLPPAARRPALLPDHRCVRVAGKTWPRIERARGEAVRGRLLRGLSCEDWRRIQVFEGDGYRFRAIRVWCCGRWQSALFCDYVGSRGRGRRWDYASWQRRHRRGFVSRLRGLHGSVPAGVPARRSLQALERS